MIHIDLLKVTHFIEGKSVLITGSGGSIGSELSRQIARFNPRQLILTDNSEHFLYEIETEIRDAMPGLNLVARIADVRNRERIDSLFAKFKPDAVFHAAAIKHVPMAEKNIGEAIKTNVLGTRNCANAAVNNNASVFVLISTDKAVNPTNVMGATKRAAECYCQAMDIYPMAPGSKPFVSEMCWIRTVRSFRGSRSKSSAADQLPSPTPMSCDISTGHMNTSELKHQSFEWSPFVFN